MELCLRRWEVALCSASACPLTCRPWPPHTDCFTTTVQCVVILDATYLPTYLPG